MVHFGAIAAGASPRLASAAFRYEPRWSWSHHEETFRAVRPHEIGDEIPGGSSGTPCGINVELPQKSV